MRKLLCALLLILPACERKAPAIPSVSVAESAAVVTTGDERPTYHLAPPTTAETAARHAGIQRAADAIRAECQQAAGGDWNKWQAATAPARAALKSKIDALRVVEPAKSEGHNAVYEALGGQGDFPLCEVGAKEYLEYLYNPDLLQGFRRDRAVASAARWLRRQGIDLIFVPIPKMAEVYSEHFVQPCPPDGIIAPHVRQTLLELLDLNVEVIDGFSVFRAVREPAPEYLYNACEGHWAPRGMRVMAKEVADRMVRYAFGSQARYALPRFVAKTGPYIVDSYWGQNRAAPETGITSEQLAHARSVQTVKQAVVQTSDGKPVTDDPTSPVYLIGNSFTQHFREQLVRELNMPVRSRWGGGTTTEPFTDFVREPELLAGVRVVVWLTTEHFMTRFKPLPLPVLAARDP